MKACRHAGSFWICFCKVIPQSCVWLLVLIPLDESIWERYWIKWRQKSEIMLLFPAGSNYSNVDVLGMKTKQ